MVLRPSRRTSFRRPEDTTIVPLESVQNGQSQALVSMGGTGGDFNHGADECQERGTKRLRIGYEQAC